MGQHPWPQTQGARLAKWVRRHQTEWSRERGVGGVDDEVDEDEPVGDVNRRDGLHEVELMIYNFT